MRFVVLAVGPVKDKPLRGAIDEYLDRVRRYVTCDEVEVSEDPEKLRAAIEKHGKGASIVALTPDGKTLDSPAFAAAIGKLGATGKGTLVFLIGGADGLPKDVLASASARWSLSALTFPHRLARLVLVEQLYRAMTILRGEPYAR